YTCKARHASCDEKKPVCGNCERLSLDCHPFEFIIPSAWCPPPVAEATSVEPGPGAVAGLSPEEASSASATSKSTPGLPRSRTLSVPSISSSVNPQRGSNSDPSVSLSSPSPSPLSINSEAAHLLSVYTTGVATWMDVFDHDRSYQCEVPRRCLVSSLLTKCVCAFAAKQLSLIASGEIWSAPATHYYGDALLLLIQHLNSASDSGRDDMLTANMLLSSYEMLEAHTHEHQRHLHGALALIRERGIDARSEGIDRANFWIYVRHEITIALENATPLQFSPDEWNYEWRTGETEEDILGHQVLALAARAIHLIYAPDTNLSLHSQLARIRQEAAVWLDNLPISFQGVKYGCPDDLGFEKIYFAPPSISTVSGERRKSGHCWVTLKYVVASRHGTECKSCNDWRNPWHDQGLYAVTPLGVSNSRLQILIGMDWGHMLKNSIFGNSQSGCANAKSYLCSSVAR
ncbi:uncharacterized protein PG998_011697, partial [Apiospora kogelbergensis]|uniref:uncharacterized protein n=1 Tax=Apiospora kogelbergensis TaxID=1337665 RepID=UPI003131E3AC